MILGFRTRRTRIAYCSFNAHHDLQSVCAFPPDGLGFSQVVQREEDVRVFSDAVVGEALQVDQQVVRYWNPAGFPVALPGPVTLQIHQDTRTRGHEDTRT